MNFPKSIFFLIGEWSISGNIINIHIEVSPTFLQTQKILTLRFFSLALLNRLALSNDHSCLCVVRTFSLWQRARVEECIFVSRICSKTKGMIVNMVEVEGLS